MSEATAEGEQRVEELLGLYVEQHVLHGVATDPEELCRDRPDLLDSLREHILEYHRLGRRLAPAAELAPGAMLLHFRILEKLGEGGMGQVYAAMDTKLGRQVAVKVLPPEMAEHRERLARFRQEARAVAALSHPNIVTVHSVEEHGGVHFLTMERVAGTTLRRAIPESGMPLDRLLEIGSAVAEALKVAHRRGITHRDLKPDNIMVEPKGSVKVLDFGLAKWQLEPAEVETTRALTRSAPEALTEAGRMLGTLPYMAPEQILGQPTDARTDLFALGVVLYEMALGERPFTSDHPAELISAILRDTPQPLNAARLELPQQLSRVVARCLEKDPAERYPSAQALHEDLARLAGKARPLRPVGGRLWLSIAASALITILAVTGWAWRSRDQPEATLVADGEASAPAQDLASVAILAFENLTGDVELDWLRYGLTELVVTDLSRSAEIAVLSTGRLHEMLNAMGVAESERLSPEKTRLVGERASLATVVRGSFAQVSGKFRVAFTVEDSSTGEILGAGHVDGRGTESLFAMVDELGAAIRDHFVAEPLAEPSSAIQTITTASVEAWRLYSEGNLLYRRAKREEAILLLERAVEIDPTFALAHADLGMIHANLGHEAKAREHTRRAVEQADRLPSDQRYRVEVGYFGARWATLDRAIEAYEDALKLDPGLQNLRHNLARRYAFLERYDEALREFETLIAAGTEYRGSYVDAANVYGALGRFETGYEVLSDFATRNADDWFARLALSWHLTEWGRLEEAAETLEQLADQHAAEPFVHYARWRTETLREDWSAAESEIEQLAALDDSFARWRSAISRARHLLYQGRSAAALDPLAKATRVAAEPDGLTALAHGWAAEILLQRGEPENALAEAARARALGREEWPELYGFFLSALAEQDLGRAEAADNLVALLRERWRKRPNKVEERQLALLEGLLALARGEAETAVAALSRAEALLPPRGVEFHWHIYPQHVPVWFALGRAELAAGRPGRAVRWFERVAGSGSEHLEQPVPYVRAFYFLGKIHAQRGEWVEAQRSFVRFEAYWRDGDLDRERVSEASDARSRF